MEQSKSYSSEDTYSNLVIMEEFTTTIFWTITINIEFKGGKSWR